jgi:hypothetical protein
MRPVWVHRKRGTRYMVLSDRCKVIGQSSYDDNDPIAVFHLPIMGYRCGNADFLPSSTIFAKVQCAKMVRSGTTVVLYRDIDSGKLWIRPKSEFFDGRFYVEGATE